MYWRQIQQAFSVVRALIDLNNGNSSPSPQIVHEAFKRYLDKTNRLPVHYRSLLAQRRGDEVVTTDQDYPRMLWMWDQRARRDGVVIKRIQFPVPTTADDLVRRFAQAITPRTKVLHFCHITNVTGQLFPVRELSPLARQRGIITIVDGPGPSDTFRWRCAIWSATCMARVCTNG